MDVRLQPFCISLIILTSALARPTVQLFAYNTRLFAGSDLPGFINHYGAITTAVRLFYSAADLLIPFPGA